MRGGEGRAEVSDTYFAIFSDVDDVGSTTVYVGECEDMLEAQTKVANLVASKGSTLAGFATVDVVKVVARGPIRRAFTHVEWEP
jgi:hypothetical protein